MANFLISTAGSITEGTTTADVLNFTTANLVTMKGSDGADLITAGADATFGNNLILGGNLGADTISVGSGATLNGGGIFGGGDNDVINIGTLYSASNASTIHGGGGADSIIISAAMTMAGGKLNLNGGHDFLTASGLTINTALLALGGGNDSIEIVSGIFNIGTIAAGGGNDIISATTMSGSGMRIEGDTVGDSTFFGNDLIALTGSNFVADSLIQGGGGTDTLSIGTIGSATVAGNAGKDTLSVSATTITGGAFIAAGAGSDLISANFGLSGAVGTINGGGEADTVFFSGFAGNVNAGQSGTYIDGGAGADTINLGTITGAASLLYADATNSNIDGYDYVSAGVAATGVSTIVANVGFTASAVNGIANSNFSGTLGVVTFTGTYTDTLTARVTVLDNGLAKGQVATFVDAAGAEYIFLQGGAAAGGTSDDLLFQYSAAAGAVTGFTINNNTSIGLNIGG